MVSLALEFADRLAMAGVEPLPAATVTPLVRRDLACAIQQLVDIETDIA
jgi:hypothetical protein